ASPPEATATSAISPSTAASVARTTAARPLPGDPLLSTSGETSAARGTFAPAERDGDRQRHARQLLRCRREPVAGRGSRHGATAARGGRGDRRRRRRVDAAGVGRSFGRGGAAARRANARAAPRAGGPQRPPGSGGDS